MRSRGEPEEEFNFTGAVEPVHELNGGPTALGALEWIGAPNAEDEVAPERAHRAGVDFWGGGGMTGGFGAGCFPAVDAPGRGVWAPDV